MAPEDLDAGGELLLFVEETLPGLVDYLIEMAVSTDARRHELRLLLQHEVLTRASRGGRRVTLSYVIGTLGHAVDTSIRLSPEWKCPGWGSTSPPPPDDSTERGRLVLQLLRTRTIRICGSRDELLSTPEYQATARDSSTWPAHAVIPLLAGEDKAIRIGILELECKDQLLPAESAELIAVASVLACAKLLDVSANSEDAE